ncbi:unnamed protein product [Vitrella brassicaformis CCMP3155]|uniref:non-specific serine/threonine protein kinase n=1 Tax=Vitrella brassicaformis (strain CCMP3155) TaxID=1169540 RepID=A0A0G4FEP5_VITBC|nr:unnamed protein product [Vitrella brassicaformis CCMP3155]|eukprot:CEM11659.1 unnamed protein product [Vitrella brassicaformis CCMP3155]
MSQGDAESLREHGYVEVKLIGRGNYGTAHLVKTMESLPDGSPGTRKPKLYIAKKVPLSYLSEKEQESAMKEVEVLRRLEHPNVVAYKDSFMLEGHVLVIVMQYCEGGDLAWHIKQHQRDKKPFQEIEIMNWFVQICMALQHIHRQKILHRDLKSSNIFLTRNARIVKLGDFGISRVLDGTLEQALTVVGTPYYMSPEVCENKPYTFKSDVWALGCVLYELCVLKHAFSASNLLGLVYKIVAETYDPIPDTYSPELSRLVRSLLTKKAEERPSVEELLADPYVQSFMQEFADTNGASLTAQIQPQSKIFARMRGLPHAHSRDSPQARTVPAAHTDSSQPPVAAAEPPAAPRPSTARDDGQQQPSKPMVRETPREAALRRRREQADKHAEALKEAARVQAAEKQKAKEREAEQFYSSRGAGWYHSVRDGAGVRAMNVQIDMMRPPSQPASGQGQAMQMHGYRFSEIPQPPEAPNRRSPSQPRRSEQSVVSTTADRITSSAPPGDLQYFPSPPLPSASHHPHQQPSNQPTTPHGQRKWGQRNDKFDSYAPPTVDTLREGEMELPPPQLQHYDTEDWCDESADWDGDTNREHSGVGVGVGVGAGMGSGSEQEEYDDDFECEEEEDAVCEEEYINNETAEENADRDEQELSLVVDNYKRSLVDSGSFPAMHATRPTSTSRPSSAHRKLRPPSSSGARTTNTGTGSARTTPTSPDSASPPFAPVSPSSGHSSSQQELPIAMTMARGELLNKAKEELRGRMGGETFDKGFALLIEMRRDAKISDHDLQKRLLDTIGRDHFKRYGMELDQLVFKTLLG